MVHGVARQVPECGYWPVGLRRLAKRLTSAEWVRV
jgi:hypothetical protein